MSKPSEERVLIVEDDAATRRGLCELVRTWGYAAESAGDGAEALTRITEFRPSIVVSDMVMPNMDGLTLLRRLKQEGTAPTVVILTAQASVDTAVEAIKEGAYDYLTKPVDPQRLRIVLEKIVERQDTLREVRTLRRQLRDSGTFGRLIGHAPAMRKVYGLIERAAPTAASVLIWGESGTGKELVAQTIHDLSPRASQPFVPLNCAAIPDTLLESEIFGHEKGAFTGAHERRQGCFELADRGTLFLDEIAEMQPTLQAKLLRVLQERQFRRLGGRSEMTVDVRVIAATNVSPEDAVASGRLREDLYYRLNVFTLVLPPLRERMADLPLLMQAFIEEFNQRHGRSVVGPDAAALAALERYRWPGNVRELRNAIERAVIVCDGQFIEPAHLPPQVTEPGRAHVSGAALPDSSAALRPGMTVDDAETELILLTLEHTSQNKTKAADILGISLKTLHNKLNRLRERGRID
ncbi:MAG: sigma-54-dependent Fis family transcriptional regulator [Acidimicrobiia bacterium]|nr:sigma-54-dependent Fis family transcriptional regulator [Acidimicrobiia bacterium]